MPTYTVRTANLETTVEMRARIAEAITKAHAAHTGAPAAFAQVIFDPVAAGHHFIGGRPNPSPHVFVAGLIRAGRSPGQKDGLIATIAAEVARAAGVGPEDIWVYLQEIAPAQMVEFGRPLPEPGAEAEWVRGVSAEKRAALGHAGAWA